MRATFATVACAGLACILLTAHPPFALAQSNWNCRIQSGATHTGCGLPYSLSNFQSYYKCDNKVLVARPPTLGDLKNIVTAYDRVQAVGVGHSWNKGQFCAQQNGSSVDIVLTEIAPTLNFILNPVNPSTFTYNDPPADFPIRVDENVRSVTVAAGVPQRMVLDYLAQYTYKNQPSGWTLPAFSWFIDQTIGGAVATATHGSSMEWGSLSSQLRSIRLVLADGSERSFSRTDNEHLFRAAAMSVGRLGVISEVELAIVPQTQVTKTVITKTWEVFVDEILSVESAYNSAVSCGDSAAQSEALSRLDETQLFWSVPDATVWRMDFKHGDKTPASARPYAVQAASGSPTELYTSEQQSSSADSSSYVYHQMPSSPAGSIALMGSMPETWATVFNTAIQPYVQSGTYDRKSAFISQSEFTTRNNNFASYDQYEVAIPLSKAGTCLKALTGPMYKEGALWKGFRSQPLIRFLSSEDLYLSPANGRPTMFINLEDYVTKATNPEGSNPEFDAVMKFFRFHCDARLHWGKAGWPQYASCFDGSQEYQEQWCHFGCAVQQLDPNSKFAPETNLWQWHATRGGQAVDFASCCDSSGFQSECQCAPRTDC